MNSKVTGPFGNVLDNFLQATKKFYKKRELRRIDANISIFIESTGKIYEAHIIDISSKIIRTDLMLPLSNREPCVITFRDNPSVQLIGMPLIEDQELLAKGWSRLVLRTTLNLDAFTHQQPGRKRAAGE